MHTNSNEKPPGITLSARGLYVWRICQGPRKDYNAVEATKMLLQWRKWVPIVQKCDDSANFQLSQMIQRVIQFPVEFDDRVAVCLRFSIFRML